jgi:hypothetical protein
VLVVLRSRYIQFMEGMSLDAAISTVCCLELVICPIVIALGPACTGASPVHLPCVQLTTTKYNLHIQPEKYVRTTHVPPLS